ncbi:MFS transporter [Marinilongibacter aquaticus]|uniref:MFS transporter n=1 Tax=Marinilongibacter aquaticus TaxID=2975157 RepID=UPI0021BD4613|nr:MFS transporter [Marinilongibacter aquaticus]UBM60008.1 MFS transporter [Marinilongibacter aquaticus]
MKTNENKWVELMVILSAPLLSVIDVFIINVAIPSIKKGIHSTDADMQMVIAGYLLGYAAFLITGGRAGDQFGRKKVFFWSMLAFTVTSALCGLSNSALQLNFMRFFQGVSASFMVPQTIAFIQTIFIEPHERSKAFSYFGITLGAAAVIGQVLGGYLSEIHWVVEGWRLIFFVNVPIGILTLWGTTKYLNETPINHKNKFDYSGILILTAAIFCMIFPIIEGREKHWPLWSMALLALAAILFVYFIRNQKMKLAEDKNPLIDVSLFKLRDFNIGLLAVLFHFMLHTSYLLLSAVYLQNGLGISALDSGLYFIFPGVLFMLSSIIASKLILRFGKRVLQLGILLMGVAFIMQMLFWKPSVEFWLIISLMGLWGLGNGLVLPSLLNIALKNVPNEHAGAAAGIYSTFQQTASALGVSIIGGIFFYFVSDGWQFAYKVGLTTILFCVVLVALMLFLLPDDTNLKKATKLR